MSYRNFFIMLALLGAVLGLLPEPVAQAEQPFFYYPAYGAQRGRIRYVDGIFRNKQRVHWGGGLTSNGVAFFHDFFNAAGQIVPAIVTHKDLEADEAQTKSAQQRALESQGLADDDEARQARARDYLAQNQSLLSRLGGGSASQPTPGGGAGRKDDFGDWGESNAPKPQGPSPSKTHKDSFEDWGKKP